MRFHEPGVPVLLMSLKCGVGLNLTCASTVVMCAHSRPPPMPRPYHAAPHAVILMTPRYPPCPVAQV